MKSVLQVYIVDSALLCLGKYQVWETCKRTDYLSNDRFTNLLKDRLKLYKNPCYYEIIKQNVISTFTFGIGIIHYDICLPFIQTIIPKNSAFSAE